MTEQETEPNQPIFLKQLGNRFLISSGLDKSFMFSFDGQKWYRTYRTWLEPFWLAKKYAYILEHAKELGRLYKGYLGIEFIRTEGYHDRDNKVIYLNWGERAQLYNRVYNEIIRLQKQDLKNEELERLGQTYLTDPEEKEEEKKCRS